jgi:hypothetical protein
LSARTPSLLLAAVPKSAGDGLEGSPAWHPVVSVASVAVRHGPGPVVMGGPGWSVLGPVGSLWMCAGGVVGWSLECSAAGDAGAAAAHNS